MRPEIGYSRNKVIVSRQLQTYLLVSVFIQLIIFIAIISLIGNSAKKYEVSIYSYTSTFFWVLPAVIIFEMFFILFIIHFPYRRPYALIKLQMFNIFFCNILILSLYALRGYVYIDRGDALTYIGLAKDISTFGYFNINDIHENIYPVTSIIVSNINMLSDISHLTISQYISTYFYINFIIYIYVLSKNISCNNLFVTSVIFASIPLFFCWFMPTNYHMLLSTLYLIFVIYLVIKLCLVNKDSRIYYFIILIITYIITPMFHPISSVLLVIYILCIYISISVFREFKIYNCTIVNLKFVVFTLVVTSAWFISCYAILGNVNKLLLFLFRANETPTAAAEALNIFSKLNIMTSLKSISLMILDESIYYAISAISIYSIFKNIRYSKLEKHLFLISFCFFIGTLVLVSSFVFTGVHTPYRIINLNTNMILAPFMVGYILYQSLTRNTKVRYIILIFIGISIISSVISLYPSPLTSLPTPHITNSEVIGMNWLISFKDPGVKVSSEKLVAFRYADLIYNHEYGLKRNDLYGDFILPKHFGINESNYFDSKNNTYLIISKYVVEAYTVVWKELNKFNEKDFANIESTEIIDKIYTNEDLIIYYIVHV